MKLKKMIRDKLKFIYLTTTTSVSFFVQKDLDNCKQLSM